MAGTISRKVCSRYNGRRWLPCQNHRQPMWDIAALLTAIDTFSICYQTTPVDLTVARPFRRVPVSATMEKIEKKREKKKRKRSRKRKHVAINAASVKQWPRHELSLSSWKIREEPACSYVTLSRS